ncbi:sigma-70 family RNA polymerase sigma factor [Microbacterium rhizophilus]|uniref:sigma-70 family RNA polymerase sigma factor n=1 Tax=Microbacterium rhizophilus TaxID=3138934 RepID=UPI0031EB4AEC
MDDPPGERRVTQSSARDRRDAALRELHDRYAGSLWRYVVSLTGRPADADDIVQETLLRAWRTEGILDEDPEQLRGWLFTVARNLVIDQARSARRRHEETRDEQPDQPAADRTEQLLDTMLLQDALASLGPHHREVIVRAYFGGRSTAELARELDVAEGTVKSRLHYGLRALRLAFQERGVTR